MEVRLLAARRMGELVPPIPPKKSGKMAHKKEVSDNWTPEIPKQRLSDFRKLAEIPLKDFKEKIEDLKERKERLM